MNPAGENAPPDKRRPQEMGKSGPATGKASPSDEHRRGEADEAGPAMGENPPSDEYSRRIIPVLPGLKSYRTVPTGIHIRPLPY